MHWLQILLAPRRQPFVVGALMLAALLMGALFYSGLIQRRHLAHLAAAARRAVTDQTVVPKLKMERSSLEFELPNVKSHHPILAGEVLARNWTMAAAASHLDPDVRLNWKAYWEQAAPPVLQHNPNLTAFASLQEAYAADVDSLASDFNVADKSAALEDLQKTKFASLFESPIYTADRAAFDETSGRIADAATSTLRRDYHAALVAAVTNRHPELAGYGGALLAMENRSLEIRTRLRWLNEELASLGEVQNTAPPPAPRNGLFRAIDQFLGNDSPLAGVLKIKDFAAVALATMAVCYLITIPLELRDRRWLKIAASAALACAGMLTLQVPLSLKLAERAQNVVPFLAYLVPAALLAALWTPSLCFWAAGLFGALIDSEGSHEPDFSTLGPAYSALRQDNVREALRWIKPHLVGNELQYEALILKARLHRRLNQTLRARWSLKRALRLRNLTGKQRQYTADLLDHLDDPEHPGWRL